jgi:hypothetical protein
VVKQKTRDWLAIAGFLEICCFLLELSSHDASAADAAVPLGRLSDGLLAIQANWHHVVHVLTEAE